MVQVPIESCTGFYNANPRMIVEIFGRVHLKGAFDLNDSTATCHNPLCGNAKGP